MLVNGTAMNIGSCKGLSGFVTQDDVMHRTLTVEASSPAPYPDPNAESDLVEENIYFAANLRRPSRYTCRTSYEVSQMLTLTRTLT